MRNKEGVFNNSNELWEAACEYFQWCVDNPLHRVEKRLDGKGKIKIPTTRPFSLDDVNEHLGVDIKELEKLEEFNETAIRIKEVIYQQNYENAVVGIFPEDIMINW